MHRQRVSISSFLRSFALWAGAGGSLIFTTTWGIDIKSRGGVYRLLTG